MSSPTTDLNETPHHSSRTRIYIVGGVLGVALLIAFIILSLQNSQSYLTGGGSVLVLALPAFFAGVLSFLSPCTLPILPAYFAFTFQSNRQNIVLMTVAFFAGLATTMTLLGAIATGVSGFLFQHLDGLTFWGGAVIIVFGILSLLGKGFSGPQLSSRPSTSIAGSYLYGATFALGWTACVGPILGALLTLLASSQGVGIVQGGVLAFIYAMGLGLPLILLASFFSTLGTGSAFWKIMRGKGFEVELLGKPLYLHSTSILSGLLLIFMGVLLMTGQLERITALAANSPLSQWVVELEHQLGEWFGLFGGS